ncbi:MAG TPA: CAP domain-containing protein [Ramlibacter sp.]|uniref:CAP domain-containing protein n=1 Tax=Ramlibacter sp. TaxID=1917967 RepID=UPI002D80B188|nr:CAP domain-containing protein [Ramlibacter sp.]HET8745886.1 CAP domain-containing protein [Ramlibacter sp.]
MSSSSVFRPWVAAALLGLLCVSAADAAFHTSCSVQAREALHRINAARAHAQRCGWRSMPPAPPLRWDGTLESVAAHHSRDMATRNYFDHRSPEGRMVFERVRASGYKYQIVGENLAGGDPHVASAVQGWIDSPSHCANLMDPRYVDVAVACVGDRRSQWGTYWTMVLGRRR